ncbi:uracil-DNA glycosylase [Sphingomonas sp. TDK1]|nr:uracil-DNA glycosylase [Sphingomonas sp. TDK1]
MGAEPDNSWHRSLASALEWWDSAGVDVLVEDEVRDWFAKPAPHRTAPQPEPAVAAPLPAAFPQTFQEFVAWRTGDAAPEAGWHRPFVAPAIVPDAVWTILIDMPEPEDSDTLWGGPAGALLDRMLAAVGLSRDSVQLVPLCFARPLTGQMPTNAASTLVELASQFLSFVRPKKLLLLGHAATRAVLGAEAWPPELRLHDVNRYEANTQVVATYHPRSLIERPAAKSETWKHLLLLSRGPSL